MWVKICGNTSLADARVAVDAGANALGFVFAASPRRVTPAQTAAITAHLPQTVERYGVFVDAAFDEIVATVQEAGLTGVQLHAARYISVDGELPARLRAHFNAMPNRKRLGLLQVLHFSDNGAIFDTQLKQLQKDHSVDAVLVDSRTATAQGGTGARFDWVRAGGSFLKAAPHLRIVVAGGLAPGNVAEAIATMRPWGVDVVTGVEEQPGRKDPAKVRAFVSRARATARALATTAVARA